MANPLRTIESVYEYFGIELSGPAADAMAATHAEWANAGPVRPGSGHQYSLADFGLTREQVDDRFSGYTGVREQ